MGNRKPSALLSLFGVMLVWHDVLTKSASSKLQTTASAAPSTEQEEERPRVAKVTTQSCDSTLDGYCFNNGQCMLLVDINEHHCKCERGYYGPRCARLDFVTQPIGEKQLVLTIVCVTLLIIGLAGALYFCCKWYKNVNRSDRDTKESRVLSVCACA